MENTVCVNYKENLKCLVQVANMGHEKTASPLASSMLLWFNRLSFLKPPWSCVNWSQSGSRYCFRATQDSPGVGLLRLWMHARLNPAPRFLASKYYNYSSVFPQPSSSWQECKCQLESQASQTDERRQVKQLEADLQLFTLTFLFRVFRIYLSVQITRAGQDLRYVCVFCLFCITAAPLCLYRSCVERKNSDSTAKPPTVTW